jgi:hypothetical protein
MKLGEQYNESKRAEDLVFILFSGLKSVTIEKMSDDKGFDFAVYIHEDTRQLLNPFFWIEVKSSKTNQIKHIGSDEKYKLDKKYVIRVPILPIPLAVVFVDNETDELFYAWLNDLDPENILAKKKTDIGVASEFRRLNKRSVETMLSEVKHWYKEYRNKHFHSK